MGIAASLVFPAVDSIAQETSLLRQGIDEVSSGDGTAAADNQSDSAVLPVFSTAINTDAAANAVASATNPVLATNPIPAVLMRHHVQTPIFVPPAC